MLLRPARLLFRLTADVDALESLYLRLLVPVAAALGAVLLAVVVWAVLQPWLGGAAGAVAAAGGWRHWLLFLPLTLGLAVLLAIMETVYVMTGRTIWRDMTQFWGVVFGINFAMGVATGIAMEFQFGMNWSYYSHYVGDIFGAPLALEWLMAFFLEATFVGLFSLAGIACPRSGT